MVQKTTIKSCVHKTQKATFLPKTSLNHFIDIANRKENRSQTNKWKPLNLWTITEELEIKTCVLVDPGREFMGGVTKEMEKHKTYIRRGRTEIHRLVNAASKRNIDRTKYPLEPRVHENGRTFLIYKCVP